MSFWNGKPSLYIGGEENPYLIRWHILKVWHLPRIYLHKFMRSDDDRSLHDHPWWFISILLKGSYTEVTEDGEFRRTAPSIAFRPLHHRHRVLLDTHRWHLDTSSWPGKGVDQVNPVWTIIITGPDVRGWGFWCKDTLYTIGGRHVPHDRFVPWREFDGCGE